MGKLVSNAQYFAIRELALRETAKRKWAERSNAKYGRWQFGLPSSPFPHGNLEEQGGL